MSRFNNFIRWFNTLGASGMLAAVPAMAVYADAVQHHQLPFFMWIVADLYGVAAIWVGVRVWKVCSHD